MPNEQGTKFLGFSTDELGDLSFEDIYNNDTAVKMLLHYYKQIEDENESLKTDLTTLQTYAAAYDRKKTNTMAGTIMLSISNISIGLGTSAVMKDNSFPGWCLLLFGVVLILSGIFFSFRKENDR